jgi:hypothetical protein
MVSLFDKAKAEEEKVRAKVREQVGDAGAVLTEMLSFYRRILRFPRRVCGET